MAPQSELTEARRLQSQGDTQGAIALLENHFREAQDDLEAGMLLAWLYATTDESTQAIELYRTLLSRHPDDAELHNSFGALLFKQGNLDEAGRELERAVELDPTLVASHYNLGLARFEQGEFAGAVEAFQRATELEPSRAHYRFMLARAYRGLYEFGKAAAAFRAGLALSSPPDVARAARLELALTLKHDGRFGESETELRNLLTADPKDGGALFQLGRLYLVMNRYPDAEGVFRRLTEISPENVPAHFMLGFVSYRQDAYEKAMESFRRLLELAPAHAEARYYLGMSLLKLGDRPGARRAFEETLRLDPDHVSANYNLALLLRREGEREESRERFERFRALTERRERLDALEERVRWDPTNAKFYFDLGREYARQKRTNEALRAFRRALELQPDFAAVEVAIADLLGRRNP